MEGFALLFLSIPDRMGKIPQLWSLRKRTNEFLSGPPDPDFSDGKYVRMEVISMIGWEESLDVSVKRAKDEKKLILMDFFNPN